MRVREAWGRFQTEKRGQVKAATLQDYTFLYERDIEPYLGDALQVDLTPQRLEELDRDLRARNLSERRRSSVLRLVARLKRVS